jgi:hypothetical protein
MVISNNKKVIMSQQVNNFIIDLDKVLEIFDEAQRTNDLSSFDTMLERIKKADGKRKVGEGFYDFVINLSKTIHSTSINSNVEKDASREFKNTLKLHHIKTDTDITVFELYVVLMDTSAQLLE